MQSRTPLILSSLFLGLALVACDSPKTETTASSAKASSAANASATAKASATASAVADTGKCEALGCEGEGTFFKACQCKDLAKLPPVPFEVKQGEGFQFDKPIWEVTNKTDKDIHWGSVAVFYYDASGKQLETTIKEKPYKSSRSNGSNLSFKPNETKKMGIGFKKDSAPKGYKDMEVVFDGWCYGTYKDKASHLCIKIPRTPQERPKSG